MAQLNIFHYLPKNTIIHNIDGRIKLICTIMFAITVCIATEILDLAILTFVLTIALIISRLPIKKFIVEVKYFLLLTGMVIVVQGFSIPGAPIPGFPIHSISLAGLYSGLLFGWRFILIILICTILTGTTSLTLLKNTVEWFLRPVPFIRESRVATMFSLTFVLVPLIFDQASDMQDAQKARCIQGRKNPIKRISSLIFPLLLHTFLRTDELVLAMESRCYSEFRTPVQFQTKTIDWFLLFFLGLVCYIVLLF